MTGTGRPLRALCLDIEGGHGGSSRSLHQSLRHVDRARVEPRVWCRRGGIVEGRYRDLGIDCRVIPDMPKVSALPRMSRTAILFGRFALDWLRAGTVRRALLAAATEVDLVHFNHEALFLLAGWLRRRAPRLPTTMHVRTNLWDTPVARWQCRRVATWVDGRVYITANERRTLERLAGREAPGPVIHNIVDIPTARPEPLPDIPRDERFRVACLSNYSHARGIDRLVEIAEALRDRGRRDVLFVVAGDMEPPRAAPGQLGKIARRGGRLGDYAAARGVADRFLFLGHVPTPERVLAGCHALAKPTREDNPWGRDLLEGMAAGLPAISVGRDARFVETGVTGLLQHPFDAAAAAAVLGSWSDDRAIPARLGQAARTRVADLCDGPARAADLVALWEETVSAARQTLPTRHPAPTACGPATG